MYTILICDDDRDIVSALDIYLTSEGYQTLKAYNGREAIRAAETHEIHLILMDIMMPELDGIRATARLRESGGNIPIILLTAKSEDSDKVLGLNIGADDYITKPFHPPILLARIAAVLKRTKKAGARELNKLEYKGVVLDIARGSIGYQGSHCELTKNEFKILHYLFQNTGRIIPRIELIEYLWDNQVFIDDNALSVNMTRLRGKLEHLGVQNFVETKRGMGYRL